MYLIALRFLAHKQRTEYEVIAKLQKYLSKVGANKNSPELYEVINILKEERFLNDAEFISSYIDTQIISGKKSKLEIKKFLSKKGIQLSDVEDTYNSKGISDKESLEKLAQKKLNLISNKALPDFKVKQKLAQYLISKGFAADEVFDTIDSLMGVK